MATKAKEPEKKITITQKTSGGRFEVSFEGVWTAKEIPRLQNALIKAYRVEKVKERRLAKIAEEIANQAQ